MKRYSHKSCRRYGIKLCQSAKCPVARRNYPPGVQGPKGRLRLTEYALQLAEKQKAKVIYNITEKQFRLTFDRATKVEGDAGQNLLKILEMRFDNVVYRLGIAETRAQARQLVNHGHFLLNNKKVNIPSYIVTKGDVITLHKGKENKKYFKNLQLGTKAETLPGWLNFDAKKMESKVLHAPSKDEVERNIDTQAIVEYYSRR